MTESLPSCIELLLALPQYHGVPVVSGSQSETVFYEVVLTFKQMTSLEALCDVFAHS